MRPLGHLENRAALESSSEATANARDASAGFSELLGNVYAEQGAARAAGAPTVNHRLLSLTVSRSSPNALGPMISGHQLAPGVNAPPEQAAGTDQTDGSSALLASSSRAPLTRPILKLETDLIEADAPGLREAAQDTPQNISGAAPMALEIPAEVRAPVPVTLTMGFDGVAKIDSAIMSGLAPAPAPTFALSSSIAGGLEQPGRRSTSR